MVRGRKLRPASGAVLVLLGGIAAGASAGETPTPAGPRLTSSAAWAFSLVERPAKTPGAAAFIAFLSDAPASSSNPKTTGPEPLNVPALKNTRRAYIELGAFLAFSTIRYWSEYHKWIEDWQYELKCEDQFRRYFTTEAIRYDSNAYVVNWTHVMGGALYYELARSNGLSWSSALLMDFGASLFYEYVSEWREVISINDMFLTTFGGYSLGEPWHQLSTYFHFQKSPVLKVLSFMNPLLKVNKWLDRKKPASKIYAAPGWHDFEFSVAARRSSSSGRPRSDSAYIGLETQMVLIPEYGRPGVLRKKIRDTSLSEISVDIALRQRRPGDEMTRMGWDDEVVLYGRAVSLASYRQDIDDLGRGYALSVGLGSALTYLRKRPVSYDSRAGQVHLDPPPPTPTDFRDKMAVVHMFGPVLDWTRFGREWKVRVVADSYVDFALMNAYAFNAYSAVHPIEGMKATLTYYGYHYAFGGSLSARLDLAWRSFRFRALASAHAWSSTKGRDRFQNDITNDANAVDTRLRYLVKAGWRPGRAPVQLFGMLEGLHRWGKIADVKASGWETRLFAGLSYLF